MTAAPSSNTPRDEVVTTNYELVILNASDDAFAGNLGDIGRYRQGQCPLSSSGNDGLCHGMLRCLIQRCGKAKNVVFGHAAMAVDRDDPGPAVGQSACLVEDQRADACHPLERACAFDEDTEMCSARKACYQRDWDS